MDSSRKASKTSQDRLGEDIISNLPLCLIVTILSLLPTKDAVATSILSTRWKLFWTSITTLDICDEEEFPTPSQVMIFKQFVDRVLLGREKTFLERFRLKSNGVYDGSVVNEWISSVIPGHLQQFVLFVRIKNPDSLPWGLFQSKTLVILKLYTQGKLNVHDPFSLPVQKTLHLERVKISYDTSMVHLMSACPMLEELRLSRCMGEEIRKVYIISPTLKTLTIEYLSYDEVEVPPTVLECRTVVLDTPSLQNIELVDYIEEGYAVESMNNLVAADITIQFPGWQGDWVLLESYKRALINLLNAISNVQTLCLSTTTIDVIEGFEIEMPKFSYLTCLEVLASFHVAWEPLKSLLENSPCLEKLSVLKIPGEKHIYNIGYDDLVPSCFHTHLKFITFHGVYWHKDEEIKVIEHILKNSKVLEKLILLYQPDGLDMSDLETEARFLNKLARLPRVSPICKIEVL